MATRKAQLNFENDVPTPPKPVPVPNSEPVIANPWTVDDETFDLDALSVIDCVRVFAIEIVRRHAIGETLQEIGQSSPRPLAALFTVVCTYLAGAFLKDEREIVYLVVAKGFAPRRGKECTSVELVSATLVSHDRSKTWFAIDA